MWLSQKSFVMFQLLVFRLKVLDPYRPAFDSSAEDPDYAMPPHRYLFNCYVYQFHLMQFSIVVINMVCTSLPSDDQAFRVNTYLNKNYR